MRYFVKLSHLLLQKNKLHIEAIAELKRLDHLVLENDAEFQKFKEDLKEMVLSWNRNHPDCPPMNVSMGNFSSEVMHITDGYIFPDGV